MIIFSSSEIKYNFFKDSRSFFFSCWFRFRINWYEWLFTNISSTRTQINPFGANNKSRFLFYFGHYQFWINGKYSKFYTSVFFFCKKLKSLYISNNVYSIEFAWREFFIFLRILSVCFVFGSIQYCKSNFQAQHKRLLGQCRIQVILWKKGGKWN